MSGSEKAPRVSVIMGAYQIAGLPMLDRAMDSVLGQSMGEFEFLICDDGSTDGTWEKLGEYAKRDSRVRLVRSERNQGLAAALNRCLAHARGEYVARQDADDLSASERFARQAEFLDCHREIGFVGSDVILWDDGGDWGRRRFPVRPEPEDFLFTMPFVHGALMFRRETLETVSGYRVARETRRAEDYDMLMRMYAAGIRGANLPEYLYKFREDEQARRRRKYRYRIDEAKVRWQGFSRLGLLPRGLPYVIKPLAVGLIPPRLLVRLKRMRPF